jgi:hypothetical protein
MTAEHVDSIGRLYLYYLLYTYFHIKRQEIQSTLSLCTESGRVQSIGFFPSNDNRLEINHRLSLAVNITACEGHPSITRSLPDNPFHRALKVQWYPRAAPPYLPTDNGRDNGISLNCATDATRRVS